ncbi:prion-inhibition and propagation-domain-containing protein [Xylariaceae sp. FL1651]|nr:prion-inhibition and propagation-domain-containing protein [Xylariaceae sp. FL1651]
MSGLEIPGFVVGAVGILTAFKGALDTALLIESFFDDGKTGSGYLALSYHIEKTRLYLWCQICNIDDESTCTLRNEPELVQETVMRILGEITRLYKETEGLVEKHHIGIPNLPKTDDKDGTWRSNGAVVKALSAITVKPKSRLRWTIKGKAKFEEKVAKIGKLVGDLQSFTIDASKSQSLDRALPSMALKSINNVELLQTLHDPKTKADAALAASARVKLLQTELAQSSEESVTVITNDQLRFLRNSSNLGTLRSPAAGFTPVWVEWSIINDGLGAHEYIRRIKALGYLLEQVGEPALRLPTCYGIFDDLAYEAEFGSRRIGYIFGAPREDYGLSSSLTTTTQPSLPSYEGNFRDYPPRSLSELIRDTGSTSVPLLGDRFALAFTLATSFSHFHSAGWLHKGFHSGNIVFLAQSAGTETTIKVTDPFITGFQYSRPATAHSLSGGPLENSELEHYYHPSADKGFSRRIDLYSLGVVLCEIGRWGLVGDTVSERTRRKMIDRSAWREYMIGKVLVDIGWRMGEKYQSAVRTLLECRLPDDDGDGDEDGGFFEQQYFEKIIQPLSACSA